MKLTLIFTTIFTLILSLIFTLTDTVQLIRLKDETHTYFNLFPHLFSPLHSHLQMQFNYLAKSMKLTLIFTLTDIPEFLL